MKKVVSVLLALSLLFSMVALTACKKGGGTYTVEVVNDLGTPMANIDVYIYRDAGKSDLVAFAKTDANGKMTFADAKGDKCLIVLAGVPKGYAVADTYAVSGEVTRITLKTALRTDFDLATEKVILGDVMFDFDFTDTDGNSYKLSELLKTKKAVVLNFWYTNCGPCKSEFPALQAAYEKYADKMILLAMDPIADDNAEAIAKFKADNKLKLPMGSCHPNWEKVFQLSGYPTTVVIDRTGVVSFMHTGMMTDQEELETIFAYYTADNYVQKVTTNSDDLLAPVEDAEPDGSAEHPFEIGGVLEFNAEVKAGATVYYNVYRVDGTTLEIADETATVTYEGKTYKPENGVVSLPVSIEDVTLPALLAIANTGSADKTYHVTFSYPGGTASNPYELKPGEVSVSLKKDNDQGTVYKFVATENGTLTFKVNSVTASVKYDVSLYNLNTYAMRTLEEDGNGTSVSVDVNKGNEVQVTVSALPNENNEYPAATVKATVSFKAGAGAGNVGQVSNLTYSITVRDNNGKAISGVKFTFTVEDKSANATTNASGVASALLPSGDCVAVMTLPSGYIAPALEFALNANKKSTTVTLEKEEIDTSVGTTPTDYAVKLVDANGKAVTGVTVQFYVGSSKKGEKKVGSDGVAKINLMDATYTVKLSGTSKKYDESVAKVTPTAASIELLLTDKSVGSDATDGYKSNKYVVEAGATYVTLKPGKTNYVQFTPTKSGLYLFTVTNPSAIVGYYGMPHYIQHNTVENEDYKPDAEGNTFSLNIRDSQIGGSYVIGVAAPTNVSATILRVTRIGNAGASIADQPWVDYTGAAVKAFTYSGGALTNFDMTASTDTYKLVLGSDGYYHLGSATGKLVYIRLGSKSPYISMQAMLGLDGGPAGGTFGSYQYEGGQLIKESYNALLTEYVNKMDAKEGIYPLTKDLVYMMQQGGEHRGWWDSSAGTYLFMDDNFDPLPNINNEIAWMFALCYEK
ncbi:MAG: redoxin domain-containing protein [Clostridia bacterium]|nr:redoxin domain-containing protein [Clostridia bacterium]